MQTCFYFCSCDCLHLCQDTMYFLDFHLCHCVLVKWCYLHHFSLQHNSLSHQLWHLELYILKHNAQTFDNYSTVLEICYTLILDCLFLTLWLSFLLLHNWSYYCWNSSIVHDHGLYLEHIIFCSELAFFFFELTSILRSCFLIPCFFFCFSL